MGKIRSFTAWLEAVAAPAMGLDPNQTQTYVPKGTRSTADGRNDPTVVYSQPKATASLPADPEIIKATQNLKGIHQQLTGIFAKAREKAASFRYPQMKAAFDRELIAGIDGVGRAHAIILPNSEGNENE